MRRSRRLALVLSVLPLFAANPTPPLHAQNPADPPFVETIEVREVELRVDLSALPKFEAIGKKGQEDFIVVENGVAYPLTEMSESAPSDWIFVLYFDPLLAPAEQRQRAAIELASQAARLTAGGLAEIVVADPLPRSVLTTADPERLRQELDSMAIAAGRETPSAAGTTSLAAGTAARLAQLDRLTVELAARGGGGARALILPVGSWPLDPEGLARLTATPAAGRNETSEFEPLRETARVLAGYGWVTLPLALRAPSDVAEPSAAERRTQVSMGGGGDQRTTVPIVSISGKEESADPATTAQVRTLTDFSLIPFSTLARASSGALVGDRDRLQASLADLLHRRQFTYRSPFPQPGRLMALEVRWKGGDGRELGAQRWLRSATPPEVTAARLRRLLAGDPAPQLPASAAIRWTQDSGRVCFPGEGEKRWVRISSAREKSGAIEIASGEPLQIERGADGLCAPAPPLDASNSRSVRLAEDLEGDTWTGALVTKP